MTILDRITARKREEVSLRKTATSSAELREQPLFEVARRSLAYSIQLDGSSGLIAEFKRKSPSKGSFVHELASAAPIVKAYDDYGAAGISVLTDGPFFGGSFQDLADTRALVETPLLQKDFIIDAYQLLEAKAFGADAILLIASVLSVEQVAELAEEAVELGLEVLLELHSEAELGHVCAHTALVGINNRNLNNFEVDLEHSIRLAQHIPIGKIKVAESGIQNPEQVLLLREKGFDAFLVGERFMKDPDPAGAFAAFAGALKKQIL